MAMLLQALAVDAAPQFGAPKHDEVGVNLSTGRRRPAML